MPFPGGGELLVVLLIVLVLFGGSKLPQLARNLGQAQREIRRAADDDEPDAADARTGRHGGPPQEPRRDRTGES